MKTLLIILFPLLTFGQKQTFENHLYNSSSWYNEFGIIKDGSTITKNSCYFSVIKHVSNVELNIISNEPLLSHVFILTNNGNISLPIDRIKAKKRLSNDLYYKAEIDLRFENKTLWTCLDSGIKKIVCHTLKGVTIELIINDKLTKLKDYAK